jgi:predicted GH43/DUF377 family glycosyl hydrolase
MKSLFFKLFLLITFLFSSNADLLAQYIWTEYAGNPLNVQGTPGSWDASVVVPSVIFNSDSNRFEMWYTSFTGSFPNGGIGFAYSSDGINWTKHPSAVMTPGATGWDSLFVGAASVIKESGSYKMWYTGWKSFTRLPRSIGYATSPDGINWTKYSGNPVLSPLTGWESGGVGYQSVIKMTGGYLMFYTGEAANALTGRAISSDGITWERYSNNPVLPAGGIGEWDRSNYLGKVIAIEDTLYMYYTGESNPGISGSAIGMATSNDTGKTWNKYIHNPIITRSTWNSGWTESGSVLFSQNKLWLYYDGGSTSGGRIGFATTPFIPVSVEDETTLPKEFVLMQNYPNPFNPSTSIQYAISNMQFVSIKVYDVLGNEIETLVNEEKPIGNYEITWYAKNLPSGVYFYQLRAGSFIETKKMILLR